MSPKVIKDQGLQGKVLAVGTDRTAEQLAAIKDGTVFATITQDTFAEEWTALYFLYWKYNGLSSISDTVLHQARGGHQRQRRGDGKAIRLADAAQGRF